MNIAVVGGDQRFDYLCDLLSLKFDAFRIGDKNGLENSRYYFDTVILPLPFSRDRETINTTDNQIIPLSSVLDHKPKLICGGMLSNNFIAAAGTMNINCLDYFNNEVLTQKNAMLTAEAVLAEAINELPEALLGKKVLICGYGRIGRLLARYLNCIGAQVSVAARRPKAIAQIYTDGYSYLDINRLTGRLSKFDIIFNTVPSLIFDCELITCLDKDTVYFEIASISGIDKSKAEQNGIRIIPAGGLPGKYFPKSAAEYILEVIMPALGRVN